MYRLLIVDTNQDICENIKKLLDWPRYGFNCIMTACSYADAVNIAIDLQPHVAITDINLGEHRGYELATHLRAVGLKTIFCMISDYDNTYYLRKSMQACAQDFLLKPVNVEDLRTFVERIIINELHGTLPRVPTDQHEIDPVLKADYSNYSKITNKIILYIKSNYHRSQSLTAIAESFHMSSKYIGRIFLKDTGIKFTEYLMAYRMLQARRLIMNTREKISVIAGMVGYSQLNNFYTHFHNYFGTSPSALRQFNTSRESPAEGCEHRRSDPISTFPTDLEP